MRCRHAVQAHMEREQGVCGTGSWSAIVEGFRGVCARVAAAVQSRCLGLLDRGLMIPGMPVEIVPMEAFVVDARQAMGVQQPTPPQDPYARLGLRTIVEGRPQPPLTYILQPPDLGWDPEETLEELMDPDP